MININKIIIIIFITFFCFVKSNAKIEDSLFATVGNKAITQSDIVKEIKIILILTGQSFSEEKREALQSAAVKSSIRRAVKQIEIEKYPSLQINEVDLNNKLIDMAINLDMSLDALKGIFLANTIDFSNVVEQVKIELLWNSLIFELYKGMISVNVEEIDEQLKSIKDKKLVKKEYLLSEILIQSVSKENLESKIKEVLNKIENEGFKEVAISLGISETSTKGGNLGWVNEDVISDKLISNIRNATIGSIIDPILLPSGILFMKVRDKREIDTLTNLELAKKNLITLEKTKILTMHSVSHYDKLRRSMSVDYHNK